MFAIVIFCIVLTIAYGSNSVDKAWRWRKTKCEKTECAHMIPEEAYNCVNQCTSPTCYEEVYAAAPLEDGEIDSTRARMFTGCMREGAKADRVSTTSLFVLFDEADGSFSDRGYMEASQRELDAATAEVRETVVALVTYLFKHLAQFCCHIIQTYTQVYVRVFLSARTTCAA